MKCIVGPCLVSCYTCSHAKIQYNTYKKVFRQRVHKRKRCKIFIEFFLRLSCIIVPYMYKLFTAYTPNQRSKLKDFFLEYFFYLCRRVMSRCMYIIIIIIDISCKYLGLYFVTFYS